jgi:hypothetical protein
MDESNKMFKNGCELVLADYIEDHISSVVNLAFFMAVVEVVTTVATGFLAFGIRQEEEDCASCCESDVQG